MSQQFKLKAEFQPAGDQIQAIAQLCEQQKELTRQESVLLGVTGSGKTFTMANVIQNLQRPALILAHNKTLAAQLYQEFKEFFPDNAVEYFVSYYDYYQPEAYIARTDTYIEKDCAINDEIDKLRLRATRSLIERRDVIVVASVSAIYGIGSPKFYRDMHLALNCDQEIDPQEVIEHLVEMQYTRNDFELNRALFRVRGDVIDIIPTEDDTIAYRICFLGDSIESIEKIDPLTGRHLEKLDSVTIFPNSHYVVPQNIREKAFDTIRQELNERVDELRKEEKILEVERLLQRTRNDLEMIEEIGFCKGIENYSRHFSGRKAGDPPPCLLDYFPKDFLFFIDESHQTLPQIRAMYHGDLSRKKALVNFGFRLPSAYDNRPLKFEEVEPFFNHAVYVSATPAPWEIDVSNHSIVEQIIRPTGLIDPIVEVRKASYQVENVIYEIQEVVKRKGRVLVTTLTKKLAELLNNHLLDRGIASKYLHSDVKTLDRILIIDDLRQGKVDVIVGINLLREGLDIPEVELVAILDGDKEGFLRSSTALIQTCGRAARNVNGRVIIYADKMTNSIQKTLDETNRRRKLQQDYNQEHQITPKTIYKKNSKVVEEVLKMRKASSQSRSKTGKVATPEQVEKQISFYQKKMLKAAKEHRYEEAAELRDQLHYWKSVDLTIYTD